MSEIIYIVFVIVSRLLSAASTAAFVMALFSLFSITWVTFFKCLGLNVIAFVIAVIAGAIANNK